MYYVRLIPGTLDISIEQKERLIEMSLPTPEQRWPFPKDEYDSHLIEVYKKGTFQECQDAIRLEEKGLQKLLEIIKHPCGQS